MRHFISLLTLSLTLSTAALAEDINEIFKKVNELTAAGKYSTAIKELAWAEKELQKLNSEKLQTFLADTVAGFSGQKIESNSAMGISNIERAYTQGNVSIKASLTNAGGQMGAGLGALGQMAMMFGGAGIPGQETVRIDGKTAQLMLNPDSNSGEMTVILESGSILKLEMNNSADKATLEKFAQALKISEIDTYLKG